MPCPQPLLVEADQRSWVTLARLIEPDYRASKTLDALTKELGRLAEGQGARPVVLNCSAVQHFGSTFVTRLLGLRRKLDAQGSRVVLCDLSPPLAIALTRMHLDDFFLLCRDEREALTALGD